MSSRRSTAGCSLVEGSPRPQGRRASAGPRTICSHSSPPCAKPGSTRASSASTFHAATLRASTNGSTSSASGTTASAAASTSARGWRATSSAPSGLSGRTSCTPISFMRISTVRSRPRGAGAYVSTRHNDDRYLLGPFRYVDRAFALRTRSLIAISDAVRRFLENAGTPVGSSSRSTTGSTSCRPAPSEIDPGGAGLPVGAPLALAVGRLIAQKDHGTLLRAFAQRARATPRRTTGDPRKRAARGGDALARAGTRARWTCVVAPGPAGATRLARPRGRLRPHLSLGGLRDRAARGDARLAPDRGNERERCPGDRRRRRDRHPRRRGRRGASPRRWKSCSPSQSARQRLGAAGLERARSEFSVGRMTEQTIGGLPRRLIVASRHSRSGAIAAAKTTGAVTTRRTEVATW